MTIFINFGRRFFVTQPYYGTVKIKRSLMYYRNLVELFCFIFECTFGFWRHFKNDVYTILKRYIQIPFSPLFQTSISRLLFITESWFCYHWNQKRLMFYIMTSFFTFFVFHKSVLGTYFKQNRFFFKFLKHTENKINKQKLHWLVTPVADSW